MAVAVYVTGWGSGAHINPEVTMALATIGAFDWGMVPGYILAQVAGGFTGGVLVYRAYKQHYDETEDADGKLATLSTGPAISGAKWNATTEIIGAATLVMGVLGITNGNNNVGPMAALLVGILV